jgi:hypothetical protein
MKTKLAWLVLAATAVAAQAQSGIVLTATNHNFVSVPQGSTQKYGIHVTNTTAAPFPFQLTLDGSPAYSKQTDCPATIAPGSGCEIVFTYTAPATSEWDNATFTIATNGASFPNGNSGWLKAHAVAPGAITLNSQKHNFGQVAVGSPAPQKFGLNISNGASTAVPFSYQATGDTAAYAIETNCPATLAAGGQCSIVFGFTPTAKAWQQIKVALSTGNVPVVGGNTVTLLGQGS